MKKAIFTILVLALLFLSACAQRQVEENNNDRERVVEEVNVPSGDPNVPDEDLQGVINRQRAMLEGIEGYEAPSRENEFTYGTTRQIGDVVSGDGQEITIHGVDFVDSLTGGKYPGVQQAAAGNEYALLDISIKNTGSGDLNFGQTLLADGVEDENGNVYTYDYDAMVVTPGALLASPSGSSNSFDPFTLSLRLSPGETTRGFLPYHVPQSASDLKFVYRSNFGPTSSHRDVVIDIK